MNLTRGPLEEMVRMVARDRLPDDVTIYARVHDFGGWSLSFTRGPGRNAKHFARTISAEAIRSAAIDKGRLMSLLDDVIGWAESYFRAAPRVPFRIGLRSPRRLQITRATA